jgi:hypothetical protein
VGKDHPDEDDTADRRAGECWDALGTLGCSREAQAYPAQYPDSATRNFSGYRSSDNATGTYNAIRSLWGIRKFYRISHRSISGVVLLAVSGRDKRGPNLEKHNEVRGSAFQLSFPTDRFSCRCFEHAASGLA